MSSLENKFLDLVLKLAGLKGSIDKAFDRGNFTSGDVKEPPKRLQKSLSIVKRTVNERNVFTLSSKQGRSKTVILYFHGGAYVFGFKAIHWDFFKTLIQNTGCTIVAPDYPLAPYQTYEDAYAMIKPIYLDLIDRFGSENLILMGDSSGGGLALGLAQTMKNEELPSAKQIVLLSPWLDLSLSDPACLALDKLDPILSISGLRKAAKAYAGQTDLKHFQLSPLYGRLDGLGKISLFIGSRDLLVADARRFKKIALDQGIDLDYTEIQDMVHIGMLLPLPQSKPILKQIIALIDEPTHQSKN